MIMFNFRNMAAIIVCLAVSVMFAGCKGGNNGKSDDGGDGIIGNWPSASVLAKYGLDGMTKPPGYSNGAFNELRKEEETRTIVIIFSGNASTSTSVKKYFSDNSSWKKMYENNGNEGMVTYYSKESKGIAYVAQFTESGGKSFQILAGSEPIE